MKIIAALSVYEEEQFIYKTLESTLQIKDLVAIHILEGAWKGGGESAHSRDKTVDEIERFMRDYTSPLRPNVFLEHHPEGGFFENQSAKRNYQLKRIAILMATSGDDYYTFVIDGDEQIHFPNGLREVWLSELLKDKYPGLGMVQTYADNSDADLWTARLLPAKVGVHYHTGKNMLIHGPTCEILSNYHLESRYEAPSTWHLSTFFLVNKYPLRNKARLDQKALQYATEQERRKKGEECTFGKERA